MLLRNINKSLTYLLCAIATILLLPISLNAQWIYYNEAFNPFVSRIELNSLTEIVVRNPNTSIAELDIAFNKQGELFTTGNDNLTGPILRVDTMNFPGTLEVHRFPTPILGLCVDNDNKFWASDWNPTGGLYSYDPTSNTEIYHGNIGYPVTDLEFYNGNLYAIGWEDNLTYNDDILILVDQDNPENSRVVMELTLPFAFFSLASFSDSCGSNKLVAPGNGVIVILDPENNSYQTIDVSPSFSSAGAASKSGWMGSLPPLIIDSITIYQNPCSNSNSILIHPRRGRTGIQFSLDDQFFQNDSIYFNLSPGTHFVKITDEIGCYATSVPFIIEDFTNLTLDVDIIPSNCNLQNGQINIKYPSIIPPPEFSLDGINWQSSSNFSNLDNGNYSVFARYSSVCFDTIQILIPEIPELILNSTLTHEHCNKNDGNINILAIGGQEPYLFKLVDESIFSQNDFIDSLTSGKYTIIGIDSLGCTDTLNIEIQEINLTFEEIIIDSASCSTNTGALIIMVSNGTNPLEYSLNSELFQSTGIFNQLNPGNYQISISDSNGCILDSIVNVPVKANTLEIEGLVNHITCDLTTNGSIILNSNQTPTFYSLNNGVPQLDSLFHDLSSGQYRIVGTNVEGCSDTVNLELLKFERPIILNCIVIPEHCNLGDGSLFINEVIGGTLPFNYLIEGNSLQSLPLFNDLSQGTYSVIVIDSIGCSDTLIQTILLEPEPNLSALNIVPETCNNSNGQVEVIANSNFNLNYTLNGISNDSGVFRDLIADNYELKIEDEYGCFIEEVVSVPSIGEFEIIALNLSSEDCGDKNGSIDIITDDTISNIEIKSLDGWVRPTSLNNLQSGNYYLEIINNKGCIIDTTIFIYSKCNLYIPNVFTPNSDGINDYFGIMRNQNFSLFQFSIFSRSGDMLFQTNNPGNMWNGTFNEKQAQSGVYTWHLIYALTENNIRSELHGNVTLIR